MYTTKLVRFQPPRRIRLLVVTLIASFALAWVVAFVITPRGPEINVRWSLEFASTERASLEEELQLARGTRVDGRTWRYQLLDLTESSLRRLLSHPLVEDTSGFDRASPGILEPAPSVARRAVMGTLLLWLWILVLKTAARLLRLARIPTPEPQHWNLLAFVQIVIFVVCLGYWLVQIEFPYLDAFRHFDYINRRSWPGIWADFLSGTAEFRPLYFSVLKVVHDSFGGPSLVVFRTLQLSLVVSYLALFRALIKPRCASTWFGFTVGFCCLVGLHTANLTLVGSVALHWSLAVNIMMLGTLLLLRQGASIRLDVAAAIMSCAAAFLIEYGVAVGLMWIVAGIGRWGAARRRTALLAVCGLAFYTMLRLLTNTQALPGPFRTETGFLFEENLTVAAQQALFTGREWIFHCYNMLATLLTVLLSEPREGVYYALDAMVNGTQLKAWQLIHWTTSLLSTILIAAWIRKWSLKNKEDRRVLVLGAVVILTNSLFGYLYTRDRVPTLSGTYYALLLGLAATALWRRRSQLSAGSGRMTLTVVLVTIAAGWGFRAANTIVLARDAAWAMKDEWTDRYERLRPSRVPGTPPDDWQTDALREELRRRAISRTLRDPREDPTWMREFFERLRL